MARLMNFRTLIAETLAENDISTFKDVIKDKLYETYILKQKEIIRKILEQNDPVLGAISEIESAAKSFGGYNSKLNRGVLTLKVPNSQAARQLASFLEDSDIVEDFDVEGDPTKDGEPISLDEYDDDEKDVIDSPYDFTIALRTEAKCKDCEDEDDDEEDEDEDDDEESDDDEDEDDDEESDDDEDEDDDEDKDDKKAAFLKKMKKEHRLPIEYIPLDEVRFEKAGKWNKKAKKVTLKRKAVCPEGWTGPDCKTKVTGQMKQNWKQQGIKLSHVMKGAKKEKAVAHGSATKEFNAKHGVHKPPKVTTKALTKPTGSGAGKARKGTSSIRGSGA